MEKQLELSKEWTTKRLNLGRLLKAHNLLVTFIGAVIVFVTFVVKEGIRDYWKDTSATIDSALGAYYVRDQINALGIKIDNVSKAVDLVQTTLGDGPKRIEYISDLARFVFMTNKFDQDSARWRLYMENLSRLAAEMPLAERDQAEDKIAVLSKNIEAFRKNSTRISDLLDTNGKEAFCQLGKVEMEWRNLADEVYSLSYDVSQEARQVRENSKERYERWNFASYFFYSLGWGIGLLGRIYGIGVGSGSE